MKKMTITEEYILQNWKDIYFVQLTKGGKVFAYRTITNIVIDGCGVYYIYYKTKFIIEGQRERSFEASIDEFMEHVVINSQVELKLTAKLNLL